MSQFASRLERIQHRIAASAEISGRPAEAVTLLAICKTFPAEQVLEAIRAGLLCFGENRVQEAAEKIPTVRAQAHAALRWHLVGQLQRNKVRRALELFDVVQSLDRAALARELDKVAAAHDRRLPVLLQVNIDREPQKGGVDPDEVAPLLALCDELEQLEPMGLMAVPRACTNPEEVRPSFTRLRGLLEQLNRGRSPERCMRELSMGMSDDFEVAIEEGSTCVRLGRALFGERRSA